MDPSFYSRPVSGFRFHGRPRNPTPPLQETGNIAGVSRQQEWLNLRVMRLMVLALGHCWMLPAVRGDDSATSHRVDRLARKTGKETQQNIKKNP